MTRGHFVFSQIVLFAIVGMAVALVAWGVFVWPTYSLWHPPGGVDFARVSMMKHETILMLYLPLGLLLGVAVALIQPVWDTSLGSALANERRAILIGALLGAIGVLLGGEAGEYVLDRMQPVWLARILGATILGMLLGFALGLAERIRTGSGERLAAGIIGGTIGGALSAAIFQFVRLGVTGMSSVALMLFAACVVGAIGAVTFLQTRVRLVGVSGNGRKYDVDFSRELYSDSENIVGTALPDRAGQKANFRLYDTSVLSEHATIRFKGAWEIRRYNENVHHLYVNEERIATDAYRPLRNGDVIRFGRALKFRFVVER